MGAVALRYSHAERRFKRNCFADASGNFVFNGVVSGSYTVTPAKGSYTFTPTSRNITVNGANVTGVTFTSALAVFYDAGHRHSHFQRQRVLQFFHHYARLSPPPSETNCCWHLSAPTTRVLAPTQRLPGVSGAGVTWVLVKRANAQFGTSEIWRALSPVPLNNATVTANFSVAVAVSSITVVSFRVSICPEATVPERSVRRAAEAMWDRRKRL